ncbi:MAG: FtsH protease activity modulator HflK [Verrucomicrobiales bacterium]|jgi:membrane protease subunit HflK|nr:FtsH protease activity modulator HflK [Verrucomicrobiales bacterium]
MRIQVGNEVIEFKGPSFGGKAILAVVIAIMLLIAALGSFYTVQVEEAGVVLRFGKHIDTVEPGLHFKLPFGIDQVITVPVRRQQKQEFGFGTQGNSNPQQWTSPGEMELEKNMVTGDLNAALVEWVIQYRITEPENYLFKVRNADATLRDASESVMRQVVGDRTVDEVITIGRQEIEAECNEKLKQLVKLYELGITIDQVQLKNVDPPKPVQSSFNEVNQAQQEKEKSINVANGEYNRAVPRARGEAEKTISEAEGYATQRINEAEGDANRFSALFTEYQKASEVTRRRLYLETMEEVMPKLGKKVILDEGNDQVLPFLPLAPGGIQAK